MDNNTPLVSVIVQAYNSDDTILETLESIKKQTYTNLEVVITDDCSKDDTVSVARKWVEENQQSFADAKVITTQQNTGISGNNNRGLANAKGQYVMFLAADDIMTEDAIAYFTEYCIQNPGVIPVSRVELFSNEPCDLSSVEAYCDKCYVFAQKKKKEQYHDILIQNRVVSPAASFYPIEFMHKTKGFRDRYKWMEDYPINVSVFRKGYQFGFLDRTLIRYRISSKSVTGGNLTPVKRTERAFFFREKLWYLLGNGMIREAFGQGYYWMRYSFGGKS